MSKEGAEGLPVSPEGVPRVIPIATYTFKNPEINDGHFSEQIRLDVKKVNIRFYCTSLTRTEKHKVPTERSSFSTQRRWFGIKSHTVNDRRPVWASHVKEKTL